MVVVTVVLEECSKESTTRVEHAVPTQPMPLVVQVEEYMEGSSTSNWIHVPESPCRAAKERRKATMRTW